VARTLLLGVEFLQLTVNGYDYFKSPMNWIDMIETVFFAFFMLTLEFIQPGWEFSLFLLKIEHEIVLLLMIMAFNKLIVFIRTFSKLGLVIRMMVQCAIELIPFVIWFLLFLVFFSFSMIVLNNEVDNEVEENVEFLSHVPKAFL
jgi:hypothetical protein